MMLCVFFQSSAIAYTVLNAAPCGEIISKQDSQATKQQIEYYITGYISGYNRSKNSFIAQGMKVSEFDSLYWAIIKFCKENPLKDLEDASFDVMSQVRDR